MQLRAAPRKREGRQGYAKSAKARKLPRSLGELRESFAIFAFPRSGAALLIAAILLSGCTKPDEPVVASEVLPGVVMGTVTDVALVPLAGVNVTVEGANQSALTDATGAFRFELPPGEHVLLAALAGYKVGAQRASVASAQTAALAFVLEQLPKEEPYSVPQEANGLLGCRALLVASGEATDVPCGANDPNERARLEFPVDTVEELGGAVVEAVWEPSSSAGATLQLTVSRASGSELVPLGVAEGEERIAIALPARLLADLQAGESLVAELAAAGSLTDEEAGVDGAIVVQQPFTVYVTLFYRSEPPAGYSAVEGASGA